MNKVLCVLLGFALTGLAMANPPVTYQWDDNLTFHENVKVSGFTVWKGDTPIYVKFDNGSRCSISKSEQEIYSLLLSLHATQKAFNSLCVKNQPVSYGGINAETLHQVWL